MKWKIVGAVLIKELREMMRDRRTLAIMIVIPALLYPALFILVEQLALFGQRGLEAEPARIAVVGAEAGAVPLYSGPETRVVRGGSESVRALREGTLDAVVEFDPHEGSVHGTDRVRIHYDATRGSSTRAVEIVERSLEEWRDSLLVRRLDEQQLPRTFGTPLEISTVSVASPQQVGGYALGRFLPMILIMMTILGAFYPAIDLATGEKERGTMEPLLTTPVPADVIVAGKFAAVTLIALMAATLNLGSMLLTFQAGVLQVVRKANIDFSLPFSTIAIIFVTLALLALLFASLFLGIAVRSQSFKEAQNALTPVYIIALLPASLAIIPGVEFTPGLALVPVAGVALFFRALASGDAHLVPSLVAIAATVVYAMLALVLAVRAFGREDVLFGGGRAEVQQGSLRERLQAWHRSGSGVPRPGISLVFIAMVALLGFYGGRILQVELGEWGLLATQWLLLGLPAVLFAWGGPFAPRRVLALRPVPVRTLLAALLIVAGGIPIGWLLGWLQTFVLEFPQEMLAALEGLMRADDPIRLAWLLFLVAVTPAICEELVFRGVLFQGLARDLPMWRVIAFSAAIFGAFHLSSATVIRFLPTAWIGLLLGYVVWHSRSLYPSILMHFVNNAVAVLLVSSATLQGMLTRPSGQPHWPSLLLAPLLLALGIFLLPKRRAEPTSQHFGEQLRTGKPVADV